MDIENNNEIENKIIADPKLFLDLPKELKENKEFVLQLIEKVPKVITFVSYDFQNDETIALTAINVDPRSF